MSALGFAVEAHYEQYGWVRIVQDSSRRYCEGFLAGRSDLRPRPPQRLVRLRESGVEVLMEYPADSEPRLGIIAGFPTSWQYANAAIQMLSQLIRRTPYGGITPEGKEAAAEARTLLLRVPEWASTEKPCE